MKANKILIIMSIILTTLGAFSGVVIGANIAQSDLPEVEAMFSSQPSSISATTNIDSGITYQGILSNSSEPATGNFDLRFQLFDALSDGTQLGEQIHLGVPVNSGQFTVQLNFSPEIFAAQAIWLEIAVKPEGTGTYQPLTPRQKISAAPLALSLPNVSTDLATGQVSIGGGTSISSYEVFNIKRNIEDWVGMYIVGGGPNARPFYGYATNDTTPYKFAWTEYNGSAGEWQVWTVNGKVFSVNDGGDIYGVGDFIQSPTSDGLVKASALVECWPDPLIVRVLRSFNTITGTAVTASAGPSTGQCYVDFGFSLENRYFSAVALQSLGGIRGVTCDFDTPNVNRLRCVRWTPSDTGAAPLAGRIIITIY